MHLMHLIRLDINHSLILILSPANLHSKLILFPIKAPIPSPLEIQELEWPSKSWLPILEPLLSLELKPSWKHSHKEQISLWLVNLVLVSTQPSWLPIKLPLFPNPLRMKSNGDGSQLLEEHSQSLRMMVRNLQEDLRLFFHLNLIMSNF